MAGHWIKWEKGLVKKAEIIRIARLMKCTTQHAAGACMQVWEWAEDQTTDGTIDGITVEDVSMAVALAGIGEAMAACGWLHQEADGVVLPHWERHNAQPSKARALDSLRKRIARFEERERALLRRQAGLEQDHKLRTDYGNQD